MLRKYHALQLVFTVQMKNIDNTERGSKILKIGSVDYELETLESALNGLLGRRMTITIFFKLSEFRTSLTVHLPPVLEKWNFKKSSKCFMVLFCTLGIIDVVACWFLKFRILHFFTFVTTHVYGLPVSRWYFCMLTCFLILLSLPFQISHSFKVLQSHIGH